MSNYFQDLLDSGEIIRMMDKRTIITDRMGPWSNQCLTLAWEDASGKVSVTPDEAEILFNYGRLTNVHRIHNGTISMGFIFDDIRNFDAVIVCGTISPSNTIREEILDYAKSKGYITDEPIPVEMFSGTKNLHFNPDGTYKIEYTWTEELKASCNQPHLFRFTQKYFESEFKRRYTFYKDQKFFDANFYKNPKVTVTPDGFILDNLCEDEVFSQDNINAIRGYDFQVGCLSTKIDKNLLLKAIIQLGYADGSVPENLRIKYNASLKELRPEFSFPLYQYTPKLSKDNLSVTLESGELVYSDLAEINQYYVSYNLKVPYSEVVRQLMKHFETLMKKTYDDKTCRVRFNPYNQSVSFEAYYEKDPKYSLCGQFEKDLVTLDYAISLFQMYSQTNSDRMIYSIMCFYASESTFPYQELFTFYFSHLESKLEIPAL